MYTNEYAIIQYASNWLIIQLYVVNLSLTEPITI